MDANIIKNEKQKNDNKGEDNWPAQKKNEKNKIYGTKVKDDQRLQMNVYIVFIVQQAIQAKISKI